MEPSNVLCNAFGIANEIKFVGLCGATSSQGKWKRATRHKPIWLSRHFFFNKTSGGIKKLPVVFRSKAGWPWLAELLLVAAANFPLRRELVDGRQLF